MGTGVALRVCAGERLTPWHGPQAGLVPRRLDGHDDHGRLDLFPVDLTAAVVLERTPERLGRVVS